MIDNFSHRGPYFFLSNFYPHTVRLDGMIYPTAEHAFQAQKACDEVARALIATQPTASWAKRYGRLITCRSDWDSVKVEVMKRVLQAKFEYGSELATLLIRTAPQELKEGNWWHDNYWGDCTCSICMYKPGLNMLGQPLS